MIIKASKYNKSVSAYEEIQGVIQGFPINETIDDTLDAAVITVYDNEEELFSVWQSVKVEVWNGTDTTQLANFIKCFNVADIDKVDARLKNYKYRYTITLIEPTKYLEKVICPAMSFTNRSMLLKTQLFYALQKAEPIRVQNTTRFHLSQRLETFLAGRSGEDFWFDRGVTLREVLDGMLSSVNSRCEVYEITDFNNIEIDYYDMNKILGTISFNRLVNRKTVENIEMLGTDIEAYGDNAFSGNREPIWHPSPIGWDSLKTKEAVLTSKNGVISTEFPIESVEKFVVKCKYKLQVQISPQQFKYPEITKDLDISSNIVDSETYALLPSYSGDIYHLYETETFYKENTIYYTRGEQNILGATDRHKFIFFSYSSIKAAVGNALWRQGAYEEYLETDPEALKVVRIEEILIPTETDMMFRTLYVPYIDGHLKVSKLGYGEVPSTIISNQSDSVIDLGRFGDNLFGNINRLGNKELTVDKALKSTEELYEVGFLTADGYVLTTRSLAFYNRCIKAHYVFSKDFNNLSEKIGIDRRKRIYNIPLENFKSDTLIKEYILVDFGSSSSDNSLVNELVKTFSSSPNRPITNALVKTSWEGAWSWWTYSDLFEFPVVSYTAATCLFFHFKFMDNFSAGLSVANQVTGGKKVVPNPYTNEFGEYDRVDIRLLNHYVKTQSDSYENIKMLPKVLAEWYNNNLIPFWRTYRLKKDAYEHPQFTVAIEILPSNLNIFVGTAFAERCSLMTSKKYAYRVYVSTTEKYNFRDKKVKGFLASLQSYSINPGSLTVHFSEPGVVSWCLADEENNIILAVNRTPAGMLYKSVKFTHSLTRP